VRTGVKEVSYKGQKNAKGRTQNLYLLIISLVIFFLNTPELKKEAPNFIHVVENFENF
jgi:hypothetical protein